MERELVPVLAGAVLGLLLGGVTARRRPWVWLVLSVALGVGATFLTGEWRVSWAFVLFDVPLVAACAAAGFLASRSWLLRRPATARGRGS